jgi:hypothetical protein
MDYHYTVKNGPNGPALATSDKDLGVVRSDQKLFESIRTISSQLSDEFPPDESFNSRDEGIHSKLTQFPEKAGKTRTIAVVDYYSQRALRPLHRALMASLRSLVSDGTYSHNNVGKYAAQATKEQSFVFCADLTAFTDRFPAIIQKNLLFGLLEGREQLASAFWTLLAERQFTVAWSGEQVTYSCGQPMGAYSSWPLCSLAHHLVIEYCGRDIKNIKSKYRMIGDDVIITNEVMAQRYQEVIQALGVCINYGKTVTSPKNDIHSAAEVAKQLFVRGQTLTPLTPGIMRSLKNPMLFNSTLAVLQDRYNSNVDHARLVPILFPSEKTRKQVWMLTTNPIDGVFRRNHPMGEPALDTLGESQRCQWDVFSDEEVRIRFKLVRLRALSSQAMKLYNTPLGGYLTSWASLAAGYLDVQSFTGEAWQHCDLTLEANVLSRRWILIKLFKTLEEFAEVDVYDVDFEQLREIEYMPDPNAPFLDMKDLRCIRRSGLIEKTLESLLSEDSSTVSDDIEVPPYISIT